MPMAKRICVVAPPFTAILGGLERVALHQTRGLAATGWEVHVVTPESFIVSSSDRQTRRLHMHRIVSSPTRFAQDAANWLRKALPEHEFSIVMAYGKLGLHVGKVVALSPTPCRFVLSVQHTVLGETLSILDHFALRHDGVKRNGF